MITNGKLVIVGVNVALENFITSTIRSSQPTDIFLIIDQGEERNASTLHMQWSKQTRGSFSFTYNCID